MILTTVAICITAVKVELVQPIIWSPYHATPHHWLLIASGADTHTHTYIHIRTHAHTHMHTNTHTQTYRHPHKNNFKKLGERLV